MTTVISPTRSKSVTAKQVAHARLRVVWQELQTVTETTLTSKTLHDLRIACRRAEAALRLSGDVAYRHSCQWLRKRLSHLRRGCNEARDDDVLLKWLKQQPDPDSTRPLQREVARHRRELLPSIVKQAQALTRGKRFEQHTQKVWKSLSNAEQAQQTPAALGKRLFAELQQFVQALVTHSRDAAALHRMRIKTKRLRYSVEVVTEIWPDVDVTELQELLTALQERLGRLHDDFVREQRLKELLERLPGHSRPALPLNSERNQKRREQAAWKWWQTCPVERILADATAEIVTLIRK